jgi:hypothetical protein
MAGSFEVLKLKLIMLNRITSFNDSKCNCHKPVSGKWCAAAHWGAAKNSRGAASIFQNNFFFRTMELIIEKKSLKQFLTKPYDIMS